MSWAPMSVSMQPATTAPWVTCILHTAQHVLHHINLIVPDHIAAVARPHHHPMD